jgi:Zn-dependent peptidase ImmA (M78 family)
VEREADLYAAFLLMPKEMVLRAYEGHFGDLKPRHVELPRKEDLSAYSDPLMRKAINDWRSTAVNYRLNEFSAPLASELGVSAISMRLRLERLGLLHPIVAHQRRP